MAVNKYYDPDLKKIIDILLKRGCIKFDDFFQYFDRIGRGTLAKKLNLLIKEGIITRPKRINMGKCYCLGDDENSVMIGVKDLLVSSKKYKKEIKEIEKRAIKKAIRKNIIEP